MGLEPIIIAQLIDEAIQALNLSRVYGYWEFSDYCKIGASGPLGLFDNWGNWKIGTIGLIRLVDY